MSESVRLLTILLLLLLLCVLLIRATRNGTRLQVRSPSTQILQLTTPSATADDDMPQCALESGYIGCSTLVNNVWQSCSDTIITDTLQCVNASGQQVEKRIDRTGKQYDYRPPEFASCAEGLVQLNVQPHYYWSDYDQLHNMFVASLCTFVSNIYKL
jgi:hypothetical protein